MSLYEIHRNPPTNISCTLALRGSSAVKNQAQNRGRQPRFGMKMRADANEVIATALSEAIEVQSALVVDEPLFAAGGSTHSIISPSTTFSRESAILCRGRQKLDLRLDSKPPLAETAASTKHLGCRLAWAIVGRQFVAN